MQATLFWQPSKNSPSGKALHHSKVILEATQTPYSAVITDHSVQFQDMCLPFSFQLKFAIKEGGIQFEYEHETMSFSLPNKDDEEWRKILRNHLNQKGFHQTFKAIKKIGKGNFASVYLVQKFSNKQKYAVKAFSKEAAYSEQNGRECLIKEIEIMRQLNHPNLMKLEQVFESDNSLYIVFELLEGGQLYDKIKNKYKFSMAQAKSMMRGLLEGLVEMHAKKIMHRDLKPENILIRSKDTCNQLVIADFGLSECSDNDHYLFVRCGTPGYVAPEVINIKDMGEKYSAICDIFSIGIIFHILLFGQSIFRKKTNNEVLAQNRACSFKFQEEIYTKIPNETLDLLKKMLRVNPDERISAEQALDHPYFKLSDVEPELELLKNQSSTSSKNSSNRNQSAQTVGSPMMKKEQIKKDSCVEFVMGKSNVILGKTDTMAEVSKPNISGFGKALGPSRTSKISKFSVKPPSS